MSFVEFKELTRRIPWARQGKRRQSMNFSIEEGELLRNCRAHQVLVKQLCLNMLRRYGYLYLGSII